MTPKNETIYLRWIDEAKKGGEAAENHLRTMIRKAADHASLEEVIQISRSIWESQREFEKTRAESN